MNKKNVYKIIIQTVKVFLFSYLCLPNYVLSQRTLKELVSQSDIIFYARIISSEPHAVQGSGIHTLTKFKIIDRIKGNIEGDEYSYDQFGGTLGHMSSYATSEVGIPSSGEVILYLQYQTHMKGNPLMPIGAAGIEEGKTWSSGERVNARRFVAALKKSLTDSMAIPEFHAQQRQEGSIRGEGFKRGYKWSSIEEIRKQDPQLARKIDSLKLDPWFLPSGEPRPPVNNPYLPIPPPKVSFGKDTSPLPDFVIKKRDRLLDSLADKGIIPMDSAMRARREEKYRRKLLMEDSIKESNRFIPGRGGHRKGTEIENQQKQRELDSLSHIKRDALRPPTSSIGGVNPFTPGRMDSLSKPWLQEKKKAPAVFDTIIDVPSTLKKKTSH